MARSRKSSIELTAYDDLFQTDERAFSPMTKAVRLPQLMSSLERRWQILARSRKSSIELTAYDDLFQTDESRAEAALSKIRDIPISEIDEFPDHPFKVLMDEDMEQLVDSIKRNGVMTPATVCLKEDGFSPMTKAVRLPQLMSSLERRWQILARSRKSSIELTAYDDLFQTDESRAEAALSKIRDIPISEIDEFPDHPFKVLMDEDMEQLVDSIKRNGVMTPATVCLKEDGRYELISGHRRKKACELAGLDTLKCEVKEFSRDEAIIVMVESNLQRTTILPSEKAFAYKMRLEAMNRQGQRSDLTSSPLATKLQKGRSDVELGELVGESKDQIRRYIRLTELVPEILQMVDERQIAFRPAVEISYLSEEQQYTLLEAMEYNDATPSLSQAIKMKKYMQEGKLTDGVISSIMEEEKPNQREKPAFRDERITKLIPKSVPKGKESDFVVKALEFYNRHLQRSKAQER